jgi:hypothetical protein
VSTPLFRFPKTGWAMVSFALLGPALADEKKDPAPAITAIAPLEIVPGTTSTLRVRGLRLDTATEIRFAGAPSQIVAVVKEKKKTEVPNGLESKDVGDTQLEASLIVPADLPTGSINFTVVTPDGITPAHSLRVAEAGSLVDEKEPNNGFRQAQEIPFGKTLHGVIERDKDVDVFKFAGRAKQPIFAEIRAARLGSLLDAVITVFDEHGHILAACDDSNAGHDPQISFTPSADGKYFLCIQDAHDRGGPWAAYELEVTEAAK